MTTIAINGFGRIGRNILRALVDSGAGDINVVAINDLSPIEMQAHLLEFDSVHGRLNATVAVSEDVILLNDRPIRVTSEADPAALHWEDVDIVMECTGRFTNFDQASLHFKNGSRRVLISAPSAGSDKTIVFGVNHNSLSREDTVVSNGSCTTNCLAPIVSVLHQKVGIAKGYMTTIHSYTGDQPLLDTHHSDPYRARAAAMSIIPTSTGAARSIGLVLPELNGRLDGSAIRVPTPNVSVVDLCFESERNTSVEEINSLLTNASESIMEGVLGVSTLPLVSSDFNHNPLSSIVAADETRVQNKNFVRVLSWYDNEWGFSNRMLDTARCMANLDAAATNLAA
ncbi:MAG: type I glyceraldehyde-3-phosphate dehydrogenase [Pseudomonadota bacterium]